MNDKATDEELSMKVKRGEKILWVKKKSMHETKSKNTLSFLEGSIKKDPSKKNEQENNALMLKSFATENNPYRSFEIPESYYCKITFVSLKYFY